MYTTQYTLHSMLCTCVCVYIFIYILVLHTIYIYMRFSKSNLYNAF